MRLLVLCFVLLSPGFLVAQNNSIEVYPWNPDANNDNAIGTADLLEFLPVFGTYFGTPPEPCDYDGTPFEEWLFGINDGSVILDSVWVELEMQGTNSYFTPDCPTQITDTIIFVNYAMLKNDGIAGCVTGGHQVLWSIVGTDAFNEGIHLSLQFSPETGTFRVVMMQYYIFQIGSDGHFGQACGYTSTETLPFTEAWSLDSLGIHIENWNSAGWPSYANYLHILPYWHYAD